jgi:hypothetical protein
VREGYHLEEPAVEMDLQRVEWVWFRTWTGDGGFLNAVKTSNFKFLDLQVNC